MKRSSLLEFESAKFPVTPGEDDETNPGIFGKALAQWLANQLSAASVPAEEPFAEDFGWCVPVASKRHSLYVVCASSGGGPDEWRVFAFAEGGLFARWSGRDERQAELESLFTAVRACLEAESSIRNLVVIEA